MIKGIDYLSVYQAKKEYSPLFSTFQSMLVLTDEDAATAVSIAVSQLKASSHVEKELVGK